jgi:hypothetical protein
MNSKHARYAARGSWTNVSRIDGTIGTVGTAAT